MLPAVFIGYPDGYKGWKFWDPVSKRTIISERAEFDELSFPLSKQPLTLPPTEPSSSHSLPLPLETGGDIPPAAPIVPVAVPAPAELPATPAAPISLQPLSAPSPPPIALPAVPLARPISPPSPSPAPVLRRSSRATKAHPPDGWCIPASAQLWPIADDPEEVSTPNNADQMRYKSPEPWDEDPTEADAAELAIDAFSTAAQGGAQNESKTFREALTRPDADLWMQATLEELEAHQRNGTWSRTQLPKGATAISCRWVFKVKKNADGSIERYKARLVAKGFSQRPGFDFTETFAPTAKYQAIRTVFALSAVEDLHLQLTDISHAFINGDLDAEVYMKQPEGFETGDSSDVLCLNKSLYGLKQAACMWKVKLASVLCDSMGFKCIYSDNGIYVYQKGSDRVLMPVFVNDGVLASNSLPLLNSPVSELSKHFKLRNLGETSFILGMQVTRDRSKRILALSQRQYIVDMLDCYGMANCNAVSTPMLPGLRLSTSMAPQSDQERSEMAKHPYGNAVGSLLFLAMTTRPDIAFSVSVLCCFISNPGQPHWRAVQHLFRYLQGTKC